MTPVSSHCISRATEACSFDVAGSAKIDYRVVQYNVRFVEKPVRLTNEKLPWACH